MTLNLRPWAIALLIEAGLTACGGGGGSGAQAPAPAPPSAVISSGPLVVLANRGAQTVAAADLELNFTPAGVLASRLEGAQTAPPFELAVQVVKQQANRYSLQLSVDRLLDTGVYQGDVRVLLCADAGCVTRQAVASVDLSYTVAILPAGTSVWEGNHLTPLSPWSGIPEWAMFQGNASHTGHVPVTIDAQHISPRWQVIGTGDMLQGLSRYPQTLTVASGRLFHSGRTTLLARREFDGVLLWSHDFSLPLPGTNQPELAYPSSDPPAVVGNTVLVQAGQQSSAYLYAFDATNGERLYRSPITAQWSHYLAPTVWSSGIYQAGGTYGGVYAFDAESGTRRFFQEVLGNVGLWTPAVDATGAYYYGRGQLLAFDPASGALRTSIDFPGGSQSGYDLVGAPVIGGSGRVYAGTYGDSTVDGGSRGNTLVAFDVPGRRIAWQLEGNFPSTPAYHDGHLHVANEHPYQIESRAESDGSLEWTWTPPPEAGTHFTSEVLLTNNLMFIATDTTTYAVDLATRQVVWSHRMGGRLALSSQGVLYIQNHVLIRAFNLK